MGKNPPGEASGKYYIRYSRQSDLLLHDFHKIL